MRGRVGWYRAAPAHLQLGHTYDAVDALDSQCRQQVLVVPLRVLDKQAHIARLRVVKRVWQRDLMRLCLLGRAQPPDGDVEVYSLL